MENKYDIFISYSRKDHEVATDICHFLDQHGLSYWIDRRGIESGEAFAQSVMKAIQDSKLFLYILSKSSSQSRSCINELSVAQSYNKQLFPLTVDYSYQEMSHELIFLIGDISWANYFDKKRWQRDLLHYFQNSTEKDYPVTQKKLPE